MADKWDEIAAGCWLKCKAAFRQWWKVEEYDQQTVVSIFAAAFREQFEALRNAAQTAEEGWRESDNRVADLEGQVESANNWWRQECAAAKQGRFCDVCNVVCAECSKAGVELRKRAA